MIHWPTVWLSCAVSLATNVVLLLLKVWGVWG
jgi:hypothetical protein